MKKSVVVAVMALVIAGGSPAFVAHAEDNVVDKTGDWFATLGKKGAEKDMAKAQRRANREAKRAEKAARKEAKKALGNLGQ